MIPSRLKPFLPFLARYKKEVTIGILSLVITDVLTMVIPWWIKKFIDSLAENPSSDDLSVYAGGLVLTAFLLGIGRYGWRQYLFGPSRRMEVDIQNKLFSHFLTLDRTYFQSQKIGDLISRATNDLRAVKDFLGLGLLVLIDAVVVIVASITLMVSLNPELTLYCLLPLPVVSILFFGFIKNISLRHTAIQENLSRITDRVQENLAGIRVLHAFVREAYEKSRFEDLNREHIRRNMSLAKLFGVFTPSLSLTIGVSALISLWIGAKAVVVGEFSLGSFVAFNGYLMLLSWPMMAIGYIVNLSQKGLTAMGRLQEIFNASPTLKPVSGPGKLPQLKGAVEFQNVTFRYPGSTQPGLANFSFKLSAGQSMAVIGPVGAGKSTLLNLILRHFDIEEGTILIDQVPIQDINPEVLRQGIGVVEQESFLFSLSVRDNIAFGYPDASDEEINDIVDCVNLNDDIKSWPEGLNTIVGDRGVSLSGGQKQRIALARALIKKPRLLLLDDAFSSLDVETERIVFTNIRERLKGVTPILVTHRLALGRNLDRIIVVENGTLAAQGTHSELMAAPGYYKNVFGSQALAQEMEIILQ
ncbi:MAG: ABC transporter ATP-binding protein [Candidatus Nitronauta litoralis]|uniref:ABC transporter ATP-binding protein n=1 Tax=Candidatus Nitronauta litoralis TaxID=2705533 RepID=A0A7T0BXR1_9BACT|nr:MAG: ABC transporter ATP-binding protein [Candidatus Nitronauta litoralis]